MYNRNHVMESQKQVTFTTLVTAQIGADVLKKDLFRKKRKGGKLDPKSYIITAKYSKGCYSLRSVDNPFDCIKSMNGDDLKLFTAKTD